MYLHINPLLTYYKEVLPLIPVIWLHWRIDNVVFFAVFMALDMALLAVHVAEIKKPVCQASKSINSFSVNKEKQIKLTTAVHRTILFFIIALD